MGNMPITVNTPVHHIACLRLKKYHSTILRSRIATEALLTVFMRRECRVTLRHASNDNMKDTVVMNNDTVFYSDYIRFPFNLNIQCPYHACAYVPKTWAT